MLEKNNNNNLNIIIILFLSFLVKIKSTIITDTYYPVSLPLYNDNILLIANNKIIFYDDSLNSIIKSYNLSESEIATDFKETYKSMACQYPLVYNCYILVLVKDQLYFFDKDGNKLQKENFTSEFEEQNYYEVIPIKKIENELYYIFTFNTKSYPYYIKFFYYKMNINTGKNNLIIEKIYTPLTISGNEISRISTNSACVLMNSNEANDIFTCIYSIEYPCAIGISSFSLDNDNMTELSSYSTLMSFTQQSYINILKEKANEDKSKAYIVLITYEKARYSAIYDMNLNKISNIEKKVGEFCVGTDIRRFNFFYFKRTEQFVIFFRDNNINFRIIIMNKTYDAIYNESGDIILSYNNYYSFNRISIIYLKNELRYFLLSDATISNEPDGIKIFSFNLTNNLTNNYNDYDYENDSNQVNSYLIQEEERKEEEEEERKE